MYPVKQSTSLVVPFFAHDANGDGVTGMTDGGFTKRISKNGGAFGAMTVTISEMENGWYSMTLSTSHTDTLGILSISLSNASCKRINLQFRVSARIFDDMAFPATSGRSLDVGTSGGVLLQGVTHTGAVIPTVSTLTGHTPQTGDNYTRIGATGSGLTSLAQASVCTNTRLAELDAANLPADVDSLKSRVPAALVGGRMDSSVGAMANDVITAAALATDAGDEIADQVWDEDLTGHSTEGTGGGDMATIKLGVAAIEVDTQDIQSRLPAALVSGRMDSDVGAMQADVITASALATDAGDEIADQVWDEATSGHAGLGSAGKALTDILDDTGSSGVRVSSLNAAALADFFNTDSGTTYGAAVSGSVVKEIADNAGGSALTEAGIADAVWNELQADHVAAGSFGEIATEIASILTDTAEIGAAGAGLTALAQASVCTEARLAELDAANLPTDVAGVQADTDDIQSRLPAALVGGRMDADVGAISGDAPAADNLETMLDGTGGQTLSLGQLRINSSAAGGGIDIDNSAGPAVDARGTIGIYAEGSGASNYGIEAKGTGATDSGGIKASATTSGEGIEGVAAGNGHGLYVVGAGSGEGIHATAGGGANAHGAHFEGVGANSHGVLMSRGGVGGDDLKFANNDCTIPVVTLVNGLNTDVVDANALAADAVAEIQSGLGTSANQTTLLSRIGVPSDLGSGADVASNLVDIEAQTDDIGAAGAGLTALAQASVCTEARLAELDAGNLPTDVAGVQADTDDIQTRLPAALVGGRMDANIGSVGGATGGVSAYDRSLRTIVEGTVDAGATQTSIPTSSLAPAAAADDQFKGRVLIFDESTTTANLRGQATGITASTAAGVLTVDTLTDAPASGDTFVIL